MRWMPPKMSLSGRILLLTPSSTWIQARHASLNSAIGRGIRRSRPVDISSTRRSDAADGQRRIRRDETRYPLQSQRQMTPKKPGMPDFDENEFIRTGSFRSLPRERQDHGQLKWKQEERSSKRGFSESPKTPKWKQEEQSSKRGFSESPKTPKWKQEEQSSKRDYSENPKVSKWKQEVQSSKRVFSESPKPSSTRSRAHRVTAQMPERVKENVKVPDSIPYTSPASEFIYGTGAVEAALRCSRRQLYKLYLYQGAGEELSSTKVALRKLALSKSIGIKLAFAGWDRLLDKMSAGRPHNGCVLEASPLPKLPVRGFHAVPSRTESHFQVELAPQTREEVSVNGTDNHIPILRPPTLTQGHQTDRYPMTLLLDGVVDPGNMGAIIRSAYYLGIDAIVFAGRNSAPLSPVTIKASAGAAENMTLLQVKNEVDFIQRSKHNGWRFYAADAPGPGTTYLDRLSADGESSGNGHPITQAPSVLMLGSEGSGLSSHIKSHADAIVSIPGARHSFDLGVESDPARIDSLNVSVAAALLMEMFLRTPLGVSELVKKGRDMMW